MRKIYGRGLNISCQLDNSYKNIKEFKQLYNLPVVQVGCGYLQSYFLLQNGALLKRGAYMDTLSNLRAIAHYKFSPTLYKVLQLIGQGARKIGIPLKTKDFLQISAGQLSEHVNFRKAIFNHAAAHLFDQKNNMHVVGQNYFGQRATGNQITMDDKLRVLEQIKVEDPKVKDRNKLTSKIGFKVVDAAIGFHHSILITQNGEAFGCGRADYNQIQPYKFNSSKDIKTVAYIVVPQLVYSKEKVRKAACGNKHTILYTQGGKLYSLGDNTFGQCGQSIKHFNTVSRIQEIMFPYLEGQRILDIKCGSYHTLILTNMHLYFMGSIKMNQNPFTKFKQNISSPTIMDLPSKPIKIFTQFERTAVICEDGKAYLFGGQDLSKYGGQTGKYQIIDSLKFDQNSLIGLGFSHTLLVP